LAPLKNTKSISLLLASAFDLLTVELPETQYELKSRHTAYSRAAKDYDLMYLELTINSSLESKFHHQSHLETSEIRIKWCTSSTGKRD
jgi:hypothetical protein